MARSRYHIFNGDTTPYFITETTVNWLPLFSNPAIPKIILDSLRYLQECRELDIYAYVLMENHMQEGHHPQVITSREMMLQKIEYIHDNPVRRGYVDVPEQWRYSSARNYMGETGILEVLMEW